MSCVLSPVSRLPCPCLLRLAVSRFVVFFFALLCEFPFCCCCCENRTLIYGVCAARKKVWPIAGGAEGSQAERERDREGESESRAKQLPRAAADDERCWRAGIVFDKSQHTHTYTHVTRTLLCTSLQPIRSSDYYLWHTLTPWKGCAVPHFAFIVPAFKTTTHAHIYIHTQTTHTATRKNCKCNS